MAAHIGLGSQYQLLIYNTIESVYGYSYGSQNLGSIFPITLGYGIAIDVGSVIFNVFALKMHTNMCFWFCVYTVARDF